MGSQFVLLKTSYEQKLAHEVSKIVNHEFSISTTIQKKNSISTVHILIEFMFHENLLSLQKKYSEYTAGLHQEFRSDMHENGSPFRTSSKL